MQKLLAWNVNEMVHMQQLLNLVFLSILVYLFQSRLRKVLISWMNSLHRPVNLFPRWVSLWKHIAEGPQAIVVILFNLREVINPNILTRDIIFLILFVVRIEWTVLSVDRDIHIELLDSYLLFALGAHHVHNNFIEDSLRWLLLYFLSFLNGIYKVSSRPLF